MTSIKGHLVAKVFMLTSNNEWNVDTADILHNSHICKTISAYKWLYSKNVTHCLTKLNQFACNLFVGIFH